MPGWHFNDRRDAMLFCNLQRTQTVARPAMKQIVTPAFQMPCSDPVEILFFRAVIMRPIKHGNEPDRMPAQRMDERSGKFVLPVAISDCVTQESPAIRRPHGFK